VCSIFVWVWVWVCARVYVCVYKWMCVWMNVCINACVCMCMYDYVYVCECACVFYLNRAKLHFISTFFLRTFRHLNNVFPQNLKIPMGIITFAFIAFYHYRRKKFDVSFSFFSRGENPILWLFQYFPFCHCYIPFYSSTDIRIILWRY
jgi:hypothetical protein